MSVINVQESFLNVALAGGKHITVQLLNGAQVSGNVRSFDKYSIVLETKTQEQLIFKHSVSALLVCCKNKRCTETCETGSGHGKPTEDFTFSAKRQACSVALPRSDQIFEVLFARM